MLCAASLVLPRTWQEKSQPSRTFGWGSFWYRLRFGGFGFRRWRKRLLEWNPFHWLASRDQLPRLMAWGALGAAFPIWFCFLAGCFSRISATQRLSFHVVMLMAYGLHLTMKCLIAAEATRRLCEDRRSGALEMLLVTRLRPKEILAGQLRALTGFFRGPILLLLTTNLSLLLMVLGPDPLRIESETAIFCLLYFGGSVLAIADFYALSWVGMWMGLRAKRHRRAVVGTMVLVMFLPWLGILCLVFLNANGVRFSKGDVELLMSLWFVTACAYDVILARHARSNLSQRFRRAAVQASAVTPSSPANHPAVLRRPLTA
jgi:hypothetical protein